MEKLFNKEVFIMQGNKPIILQYHKKQLFNTMLKRIKQWESEGKDIHILDIRESVYLVH